MRYPEGMDGKNELGPKSPASPVSDETSPSEDPRLKEVRDELLRMFRDEIPGLLPGDQLKGVFKVAGELSERIVKLEELAEKDLTHLHLFSETN